MRNLFLLTAAVAATLSAQTADLAIVNANIYTVNPKQPRAKAIAVSQRRILAVGDDVTRYLGPKTEVIDAHGATLIPGLIDSHGHVRSLGQSLETLDLQGMTSEASIAGKVRAEAEHRKPGEWILGRGWDQNLWDSKQFPNPDALSAAAPDNPVALERVDGHAVWVNRKALELADINPATPTPAGGRILPGVFIDKAQDLVRRKIPPPTQAEVERYLLKATQQLASLGITTVHDAGVDNLDLAAYKAIDLPVHVYAMLSGSNTRLVDEWLAKGPEISEKLTVRSIKLYADGALGSRGAALLAPYSDDPGNTGLLTSDRAAIRDVAVRAIAKGFQVNTHAIGDRANRTVLEAYADALKGPNDHRFRIEHAQIVAPEDFAKFRQYSVIASMQPTHATSDMPWAQTRLGPTRIEGAYAWQTFLKLGVHVASGSDFPVENPNPLSGLYSAITREAHDGTPSGGWFPSQRMSREEALRSWTLEGAWAAFEENQKGSLEPGKLADFITLSGDIMTMPSAAIWKTRVTMTVVAGKIVGGKVAWRQ